MRKGRMALIYLDHAATTPTSVEVLEAMLPFFVNQFGNPSSSYDAARTARRAIDCARAQTAALIGASAQEIYFTSGGSEADNWALCGAMRAAAPDKKHVIVSAIEHHAVLRCCEALEKEGFSVSYVPADQNGVVQLDAVRKEITEKTALISVMLANNEVGTIQPIQEIAALARENGIQMHTDAVQAVGHIPVDVHALGVDMLSMSAHKFYGPKGVGALYIQKGTRLGRLIYGGEQEKGMRAGTENVPGIVGMGKAASLAKENLDAEGKWIAALRDEMIEQLQHKLPKATINGISAQRLPGHLHMTIDHMDSNILLMQLDMLGIAASSGSACASGANERSHVMKAMGRTGSQQADLRLSLGRGNTKDEISKTIDALVRICNP